MPIKEADYDFRYSSNIKINLNFQYKYLVSSNENMLKEPHYFTAWRMAKTYTYNTSHVFVLQACPVKQAKHAVQVRSAALMALAAYQSHGGAMAALIAQMDQTNLIVHPPHAQLGISDAHDPLSV